MILFRLGKTKINGIRKITSRYESNRRDADGVRVENIPQITSLGLLEKIQKLLTNLQCEPDHFKGRVIFMSMFKDIVWDGIGNEAQCEHNSQAVAEYVRKIPRCHWSFLGPG